MATAFMKQAQGILRNAEVRLCELVPKALEGRRDEDAGRLMDLARMLAEARTSHAGTSPAEQSDAVTRATADAQRRPRPGRKRKPKARKKASPYPKFFREGNALLKVGPSKKGKAEYEHRAPLEAALAVAARVAQVASKASRFTVDDLGEVRVAEGAEPVSGCQIYLCIAWFRRAGLIVQHGRRGYSLPITSAKFPAKVRSAWGELRER